MSQFNINEIIERYRLDQDELARVLYPKAKFPRLALARVMKGEASLDVEQVERLASHLGVFASDLFLPWKGSEEDGCLTLTKGAWKAKLNYNGVFLTLYKDGEVVEQRISDHAGLTLKKFVESLDETIKTHESCQK